MNPEGDWQISYSDIGGVSFWFALIQGTIATGIFGFITFVAAISSLPQYHFIGLLAVPIIGLILSWKRPLVGGIVLILSSILPLVGIWIIPNINQDMFYGIGLMIITVIICIPLFISGVMFIVVFIRNR